jgi:asparaginyl-tRNA synthetase
VARIRNNLAFATHFFFQKRGFLYIHTPIITASDCEGAGEMFQVTNLLPKDKEKPNVPLTKEGHVDYTKDFFGKASYLTVSGQLAVENYACALSDVYTFGPTFRAEKSHTTRHLAEFWMIEPEMCK